MSPAVRAVPAGKYTPFELVKVKPFRLVSVYLLGPLMVPEGVVDAGEIEFQVVGEVTASEVVLFPSRLSTRLFVTIAAAAGGGGSSATSEEVVRANSAINAASLRPPRVTLLYSVANI
jgi:hypothetical protein